MSRIDIEIPDNYRHIEELSGDEFDIYTISCPNEYAMLVPKEPPVSFNSNEDAKSFMKDIGISYESFNSIEQGDFLQVDKKILEALVVDTSKTPLGDEALH